MKHNLLRRLSALALALVMAASLCVTPAWADQGTGPELNAHVIALQNTRSSYPLAISGLSGGNTVTLTTSGNATVNVTNPDYHAQTSGNTTTITVPDDADSVTIDAGVSVENSSGQIEVRAYDNGTQYGTIRTCHVYRGTSPVSGGPASLENLPARQSRDLFFEFDLNLTDVNVQEEINKITFSSSSPAVATVSGPTPSGANGIRATINAGTSTGRITITMALYGGYTQTWDLTVVENVDVDVTDVRISPSVLELTTGQTYNGFKTTIVPIDATNKNVIWSVEPPDEGVVSVNKNTGTVTALKAGTAVILAKAADNVNASAEGRCTVIVKESASDMTLGPATQILDLRKSPSPTGTITPTLSGANRDNVTIKWTTSNASFVDFGGQSTVTTTNSSPAVTITGKKAGSVTITAEAAFKSATGQTTTVRKTCSVTVIDGNTSFVTALTLSENEHSMPEGGSFKLSVTSFTPANAPAKSVTWKSSNEKVVTVDQNGTVKAVGFGQTVVTATADFGYDANDFCIVTVTQKAETISLSSGYDSNTQGTNKYAYRFQSTGNNDVTVTAVLGPRGGSYPPNDPIRWTSNRPAVATVSNTTGTRAIVTAVGPGSAKITAAPMDPSGKVRENVDPVELTVTVSGIVIKKDDSSVTSLTLTKGHRQVLTAEAFGTANNGNSSCDWTSSDPSIVTVNPKTGESTQLVARGAGTATIVATKGSYRASCTITVTEDTAGVIDGISTAPGTAYQFSNITSRLQAACTAKTGASLSYVTNLAVASTDQGILHDQHHSSADTGAGVGIQDRYYPGTAPQGQRSLNDLSFVPKNTFSGVAEINYTAWSTNNQSVNGVIRINVNGTGDVMYGSSEGSAVQFVADDFNQYHPNLRSVSFTLPLESRGTLYYNYSSPSQPGTKVTASDTYNRTGTPSLDRVSFVPASGYEGTVTISYRGTDTSGRSITGTVTINVTNNKGTASSPGDIYYPMYEDSWTTFNPADFSAASRAVLGETLSYVRFSLPPSSEGTLFYNYRGFGNYDSDVASTTSYYYSGTPSLSGISFVPTTTTPSQVDITYTGYTTRGNTFTGTIHIGMNDPVQQGGLRYSVSTGKSVYFNAADFNTACVSATGASLNYVLFSPLPAVGEGTLRYTRSNSSTTYNLTTSTRCYRTSSNTWDTQLNNVSFLASNTFTGTVTIPFTGYNTNGVSFTGQVVVTVTPPTTGDSVYSGTTASPIRLSSARMRSLCSGVLDRDLSYITFTSLPSSTAGRLYLGYSSFNSKGTQVNTGTRYYVSGSPSIDQISFVPRGRYTGQVSVGYTATDTNGKSVTGLLTFSVTSNANSTYFYDMGGHTWAGPAVDYLRLNNVTNGVTATSFGPEQHILRCDFVLMLCRAFNFTGGSGYSFADVPTNAYYANAVATAKQLGIVNGDGRNFMPNSVLTRQDAMVMIKNALDAAGWNVADASTSILGRFPDGTSVSSYARQAVSTLVNMGAVTGDNGMLYPYNSITRAEAAVILHFVMTM